MRKLAILLVLWAGGFPSLTMAADVATACCSLSGSVTQTVAFSQASTGVTLPSSCAVGSSSSCSQCVADLLSNGFGLAEAFNVTTGAKPYFVLQRGEED
jgi:hypothetical protein